MTTAVLNETAITRVKLRADIEITRQDTADGVVYLINDPRTGRFCQFRQLEHFTATQCDGNRSLDEIRERVNEEFDTSLSPETVEQFVNKLRELNLLESEDGQPSLKSCNARVQGRLLHLRARVFDPDRLLAWLLRPLAVVFTLEFLLLSVGFLFAATLLALTQASEISSGLVRCARTELLVGLVVALVTVTLVHELAHGLTCKRFGGPVHEIGFLLIYFLPAFYCNVSSAWAFQKKGHRLWVTFAGPWSTLLIWAAAVFCWRFSLVGTWLNTAALLVMAVTGMETFFNLNPLIKLDGYYLLSDALEIPNLRQQAFSYLGNKLRWLFGLPSNTERDVPARHRRVFIVYGTLALVYSVTLLVVVAFKVGGFLMGHYQALGFVTFVTLLSVVFRTALARVVSWPAAWLTSLKPAHPASRRSATAQPSSVASESVTNEGVHPATHPIRRIAAFVPRPVWTLACLGGPFAVLGLYPAELTVVGNVEVLADKKVEIRAEVDGLISSVPVTEGQTVSSTQLIACLESRELSAELAQIEAQIKRQQAERALLKSGAKPEEIQLAEAAVATANTCYQHASLRLKEAEKMQSQRLQVAVATVREAESSLHYFNSQLARQETLVKTRAVSLSQLEQSEAEVRQRNAKLVAAKASENLIRAEQLAALREQLAVSEKKWQEEKERHRVLLAGPKPEKVEALEAEIARLAARRQYLEDQIRRTAVFSPIDGVVTTARLEQLVNRNVQRGELIAVVQQLGTMRVELSVLETEIGDVEVGRPMTLRVLAYPGRNFHGQVTRIAPAAAEAVGMSEEQVSRSFIVTTQIENESMLLKPGMTGKAKIVGGERLSMGRLLVRKLAQAVQVEFWSWWPRFV